MIGHKVELKALEAPKMPYYTSIYSKSYWVSRALYECLRKNWTIENIGDGFYKVSDKEESWNTHFSFNGSVCGCGCEFFTKNQVGTCSHIEAIKRCAVKKSGCPNEMVWIQYGPTPKLVLTKGKKHQELIAHKDSLECNCIIIPGVKEYLENHQSPYKFEKKEYTEQEFNIFENITLRDYQVESIAKMLNCGRSILTLKMGLGKTICSLVCCKILNKDRVIIICPNTLKYQWEAEINRFNLGSSIIINKGKDLVKYGNEKFIIVNYEVLNRNREFLNKYEFDIAIIDEIQKIKNDSGKTWETISFLKTNYLFALSGTPIQNNVSDLISVIKILDKYQFTPEWKFYEKYCLLGKTKILGWKPDTLKKLKEKIEDYIVHPTIDYSKFHMPSKNQMFNIVEINDLQKEEHDKNFSFAKTLLAKSVNTPLTFGEKAILNACLLKARRAITDGRLIGGNSPGNRLTEIAKLAEEISVRGEKVVIYSEWIDSLKLIAEDLKKKDIKYVEFHGEIRNKTRAKNLFSFINDDSIKVFLSTDSGGLGVDGLQLASKNLIHVEDLWNPMKMEQRNGRLIRLLQKSNFVNVYRFNSGSGVEDMILESTERKYKVIKDVFG